MKKRTVALLMAAVLLFGAAVGGTFAWLQASTQTITNTFTAGKVAITLTETEPGEGERYTIKMVPGDPIAKNPTLTVLSGSEDCYLYVEVVKSAALDQYISYTMADGWTKLGETNIWYRSASNITSDQAYSIIAGDTVTVNNSVTSEMMAAVSRNEDPVQVKLSFTGYAVQSDAGADAATAWANTFGKA